MKTRLTKSAVGTDLKFIIIFPLEKLACQDKDAFLIGWNLDDFRCLIAFLTAIIERPCVVGCESWKRVLYSIVEGSSVGWFEGCELGNLEGREDGKQEGWELGPIEGFELGRCKLGALDGREYGRSEGCELGTSEGLELGWSEWQSEGLENGCDEDCLW